MLSSLSTKARLIALVLAIWFPCMLALALAAYSTYESEEATARRSIVEVAHSVHAGVRAELSAQLALATAFANSTTLERRDIDSFHREARASSQPGRRWLFLVTRDQQVSNGLRAAPESIPRVAAAPFVEKGYATAFSRQGPVLGAPVVALFVPEHTTPPRYNVAVSISAKVLQELVSQQPLITGAVVSVINAEQVVVARSLDGARWIGTPASDEIKGRVRRKADGFLSLVSFDGTPMLVYVAPPDEFGWTVVTGVAKSRLTSVAVAVTTKATAASVVLLLLALALARFCARGIHNAMIELSHAARALSRGEVPRAIRTRVIEADEVGTALSEAGARIHEARAVLEQRVADAVSRASEAQARLLEAQKREAIGRLTGGLAHDFNNLLQTISLGLQVIKRTVPAGPHERAVEGALNATRKAAELVRHIQVFGRTVSVPPRPVELRNFILEREAILRNALGHAVTFEAELSKGVPYILVDPVQFELAMLNLVFNARDALPNGGTVRVVSREPAAGETQHLPPGNYVVVEVVDDGTGMPADVAAKVFDPYFTTKPVGLGSGLGLSQVQSFAQTSGGDVHLDSREGKGTRVSLILPAAEAQTPLHEEAIAPEQALAPLRILMVEDDPLVGSVVVPALEELGHQVDLLTSADEALARLKEGAAYELLFTDVVMPGSFNGLDLARWAATQRPRLAVVVASGYTPQAAEGLRILRKPFALNELLLAMHEALRKASGQAVPDEIAP